MNIIIIQLLIPFFALLNNDVKSPDAILGKWETIENNLIVEIYKINNEYKAKIVWFKNKNEKNNPSEKWLDIKNPNEALRNRRLLGMEVLQHMIYNPKNNRWEYGKIYDCTTGKEWYSSAWLTKDNMLNVRGFWHFEFLGKNMLFKKL